MRALAILCWLGIPLAFHAMAIGCSDSSSTEGGGGTGTTDGGATDSLVKVDQGGVNNFDADDADDACSAQSQKAIRVPVDMHIMMDTSGSMADKAANTQTMKWDAITTALGEFLGSTTDTDLGVGIQFFPLRDKASPTPCPNTVECGTKAACLDQPLGDRLCFDRCTTPAECGDSECIKVSVIDQVCSNVTCNDGKYAAPDVEIAPLPGAAQDIIQAMQHRKPEGGTPTVPALKGAIAHASQWASQHTDHKTVVVFATDGLPTLCPFATDGTPEQTASIDAAKQVAAEAAAAAPQVLTFVIGVVKDSDNSSGNLNAIAASGGTQQAFIIEPNQDTVAQFRAALEKIRGQMECVFMIPEVDAGTLNWGKVNVVYTPGSGEAATLGYVLDESKCTADGGWYYDTDPAVAVPTRILLCPASCNTAQSDSKAKIDIAIGCRTIIAGPK